MSMRFEANARPLEYNLNKLTVNLVRAPSLSKTLSAKVTVNVYYTIDSIALGKFNVTCHSA